MTEAEIAPLACGRDAALVWDRAEAGLPLDAHGRACPHCSAAYAEARRLDAAAHRMAATPVPVPEQTLEAVLGRVLETARNRRPPEPLRLDSPLGPNRLARTAAATVLRELEGLGYGEIAEITGAGETAVRGRIHRARVQLAGVMRAWK